MTPRGTLGLCCVHILPCERIPLVILRSHLPIMTHSAVFTLLFILELCYKPLGILQSVTKSQKVHFSSNDGLQDFITSTLVTIGPRAS